MRRAKKCECAFIKYCFVIEEGDFNLIEKNSYRYDKNTSQPVNATPPDRPPPLIQQNDKTVRGGHAMNNNARSAIIPFFWIYD
eukprot:6194191-Pleurochrysis_carterae.AAC.2